jgi:hypothetical protein
MLSLLAWSRGRQVRGMDPRYSRGKWGATTLSSGRDLCVIGGKSRRVASNQLSGEDCAELVRCLPYCIWRRTSVMPTLRSVHAMHRRRHAIFLDSIKHGRICHETSSSSVLSVILLGRSAAAGMIDLDGDTDRTASIEGSEAEEDTESTATVIVLCNTDRDDSTTPEARRRIAG